MPRSPKRHGVILSGDSWTPLELPVLSSSPTSSNEDISIIMPSTPRQSVLLPGFHFSTTDENVDPIDFHRTAAELLAGEAPSKRDSALADDTVRPHVQRQLHCDLGKDPSGCFGCSCGKSYSTSLRLREHVRQCAGTTKFSCRACDKIFETKEKLDRHFAAKHVNQKEACPQCGQLFLSDQLPKHLASGLGGCDGMIQSAMGPAPEIDDEYLESSLGSNSQHFWIYDGDLSWSANRDRARDSKLDGDADRRQSEDVVEQTMAFMRQLLRRPSAIPAQKSCDICGELFDADELAHHIGKHSLDFAEKRHECEECHIFFANEKDLERHLQSVDLNDHCGFTFRHHDGVCSGHHPPAEHKSSANDHDLMQRHLWAWELSQLRTHRLTIASLLAERLSLSMSPHMSVENARRTCESLLPHFSVACRDSIFTEPDWNQTRPGSACTDFDTRLNSIISEIMPEEDVDALKSIPEDDDVRPDSAIITPPPSSKKSSLEASSRRRTILDALKQGAKGHKRAQSGPIALKEQASREAERHRSLPMQGGMVAVS